MIDKLGGRKMVAALIIIAVGSAIELLTKQGLSANLMTLLLAVFGAFAAGNGFEHFAKKGVVGKVEIPSFEELGMSPEAVAQAQAQSEAAMQTITNIQNAVNLSNQAMARILDFQEVLAPKLNVLFKTSGIREIKESAEDNLEE